MELGTGEALVSMLDSTGVPTPVERTMIRKPASRIGPLTARERQAALDASPVWGKYDTTITRQSAYELLTYGLAPVDAEVSNRQRAADLPIGFWGRLSARVATACFT